MPLFKVVIESADGKTRTETFAADGISQDAFYVHLLNEKKIATGQSGGANAYIVASFPRERLILLTREDDV